MFYVEGFTRIVGGQEIKVFCGPGANHVEMHPVMVGGQRRLKPVWSRCQRLAGMEPEAVQIPLDQMPEQLLPGLGFEKVSEGTIVVENVTEYKEGSGSIYSYRTYATGEWVPSHIKRYGTVKDSSGMIVDVTRFRNGRSYVVKLRIDNKAGQPVEVDFEKGKRQRVFEEKQEFLQAAGYLEWPIRALIEKVGPAYAAYAHEWLCDTLYLLLREGFENPQRELKAMLRQVPFSKGDSLTGSEVESVLYEAFCYTHSNHRELVPLAKGALCILDNGGVPAKTLKGHYPSLDPADYRLDQEYRRVRLQKEKDNKTVLDAVLGVA